MKCGIDGREAVDGEIAGEGMERVAVVRVAICNVRDEDGLVVLRPPREHCGDKSNAEARTLIAEEIREARGFVVFVLGQEGVGHLAYRNEQRRNSQPLQSASHCEMAIVGAQIEAREVPHRDCENAITNADEWTHADFWQKRNHHGSQHHNYEGAWAKDEACIRRGVAVELLEHLRDEDGGTEQSKTEEKIKTLASAKFRSRSKRISTTGSG